jgi:hypothetical protein
MAQDKWVVAGIAGELLTPLFCIPYSTMFRTSFAKFIGDHGSWYVCLTFINKYDLKP